MKEKTTDVNFDGIYYDWIMNGRKDKPSGHHPNDGMS